MHRREKRKGKVWQFDHQLAVHKVEWLERTGIKVKRTLGGSREQETSTSVDFARDKVLRCLSDG